jgi:hypothetical protein
MLKLIYTKKILILKLIIGLSILVFATGAASLVWATAETDFSVSTWEKAIEPAPWSSRVYHTAITLNGSSLEVLGGYDGSDKQDDWHSPDGWNWSAAAAPPWSARSGHTSVVFNAPIYNPATFRTEYYPSMFVIGGYSGNTFKNDVWRWSMYDNQWTEVTSAAAWSGRRGHASVVFNNKIWVLGGETSSGSKNDVWSSADGKIWNLETAAAAWPARWGHSAAVLNNKIWVMGGASGFSEYKNDVWSSANGKDWTREKDAPWAARVAQAAVAAQNKIFILGGLANNYKNDVWAFDGTTWVKQVENAQWAPRAGHTATFWKGTIWITGGYNQSGYLNDVWFGRPPILIVRKAGAGQGTVTTPNLGINCNFSPYEKLPYEKDPLCSESYEAGTNVVLTASPSGDAKLVSWSGCDSTAEVSGKTVCTVNMNRDRIVTAEFSPSQEISLDNWGLVTNSMFGCSLTSCVADGFEIVFRDKMLLVGGNLNADSVLRYSSDGISWGSAGNSRSLPFLHRVGHQVVVFRDKLWVLGGFNCQYGCGLYQGPGDLYDDMFLNDVRSTTDPIDSSKWQLVTSAAGWSPRIDFTAFVFKDKIWIMGGLSNTGSGNFYVYDTWSSPDGMHWTLESNNFPGGNSGSSSGLAVVWNGQVWFRKGSNLWVSSDGKNWSQVPTPNGVDAWVREKIGAYDLETYGTFAGHMVFNNRLWRILSKTGYAGAFSYTYESYVEASDPLPVYRTYLGRVGTGDGRVGQIGSPLPPPQFNCHPLPYLENETRVCNAPFVNLPSYPKNVTVDFSPASGSSLDGWFGCEIVSGSSCSFNTLSHRAVSAIFTSSYPLEVKINKFGTGSGTVTGSGITCPIACSKDFLKNASVTLTAAAANDGSQFLGWGGACSGVSGNTCAITMDQAKTVTASFSLFLDTCTRSVLALTSPVVSSCVVEKSVLASFTSTPLPTCTLNPSPASFNPGESVTLTWTATNLPAGSTAVIDNGVGQVALPSGQTTINPPGNTTYTMTVFNNAGTGICTASASVQISQPAPPGGGFLKKLREISPF